MITDSIDGVLIDTDERGFELILSGHAAEYRLNIHAVALELMRAVDREIRPWWQEGQDAAATYAPPITEEDLEAYEPGDPKRITLEREMKPMTTYQDDVSADKLESDRLREWCVVFNDNVTGESHEVRVQARSERDAYDAAFAELAHRTFTLDSITD